MNTSLSLGIVTGSMSRNAGGLFNSVRKSAVHLSEAGIATSVYAIRDEFSDADLAEWAPLVPEVFASRLPGPMPYAPGLARRLKSSDHDVLHLHGIWQLQSLAVSHWHQRTGRPAMVSPRGMLDPWAIANSSWKKKLAGAWFENRNLRDAGCLHALNRSEADAMRAYGLHNPIAIIPNGTDLPDIASRTATAGKRTLLFLGRIHPKKGLEQLVEAWNLARQHGASLSDEWRLVIAGWDDGGHVAPLQRQIEEYGLSEDISYFGPAFGADKDGLLRSADAFVLPSLSEGLPMSVLEAWAYRLPVFMTEHCNLPEGFAAGAAVQIPAEAGAMAGVLQDRLFDRELEAMGESGRSLVESRYSWPHIAEQHRLVYEWMVTGRGEPDCIVKD